MLHDCETEGYNNYYCDEEAGVICNSKLLTVNMDKSFIIIFLLHRHIRQ